MSDRSQPALSASRPTMRHVAALAGVGIKTVSRVINDEPGVSEATRDKVLSASRQLNYQLDMAAGSLRRAGRRTLSVGLLLPSVSNPFSGEINRAIEDALGARGIAVFAASLDDDPATGAGHRCGVSWAACRRAYPHAHREKPGVRIPEHSRDLPLVFIDREPVGVEADAVVTDNAAGAAAAAAHLIDGGHTRLAYLGDRTDIQTARERRRGFMEEIGRQGIPTSAIPVRENLHDEESARLAALEFLTAGEPPTAIFSSQNLITFGAMRALRELGLSTRVALIGFDDFTLADMMDPGVTVIAQHPERIGKLAAERLLARIDGDQQPPQTYVVPSELIQRGSGELRPPA